MQEKFRMKSWYWGNYCTRNKNGDYIDEDGKKMCPNNYFSPADLEPYIEEEHGWHNSEEYKVYGKELYKKPRD